MIERVLDRLFESQEIRDGCEAGTRFDGPVYLKRYFLVRNVTDDDRTAGVMARPRVSLTTHKRGDGPQLYLHHILRSDADRELHDHPWPFVALMLWRGYVEETMRSCWFCGRDADVDGCTFPETRRLRKWPGMILFRRAEHRHRIHLPAGKAAWSLVFTGRKARSWGFWRAGIFIPWRKFIARKCEELS